MAGPPAGLHASSVPMTTVGSPTVLDLSDGARFPSRLRSRRLTIAPSAPLLKPGCQKSRSGWDLMTSRGSRSIFAAAIAGPPVAGAGAVGMVMGNRLPVPRRRAAGQERQTKSCRASRRRGLELRRCPSERVKDWPGPVTSTARMTTRLHRRRRFSVESRDYLRSTATG
jgi:hypothetical protein